MKSDHGDESMSARLPDEIFERILPNLDTLDIFRMTLVCRHWKYMMHNNARHLKRAEHAVTTHLITFTEWMDPASTSVALPLDLLRFLFFRDSAQPVFSMLI